MKLLFIITATMLGLLSLGTHARDDNQFDYLGISFHADSYNNLNFLPQTDTTQLSPLLYRSSSSSAGIRGFAGHQFNRYIAVEIGMKAYEKASFRIIQEETNAEDETTTSTLHNGQFKTLAGDIRIIGTYPVSDHLFFRGHIGAVQWNNEFTFLTGNPSELSTQTLSNSDISLLTGLGAGFGINDTAAILFDVEQTEIASLTTRSLGLSILFRF